MKVREYYTFKESVLLLINDKFVSVNRMLVDLTDDHPHLIRFFAEDERVYESDLVCAAHYHNLFEVSYPNVNEMNITLKKIDSHLHGKPALYSDDYDDVYDILSIEISDLGYITFKAVCDVTAVVQYTSEVIHFEPAVIYHQHELLF